LRTVFSAIPSLRRNRTIFKPLSHELHNLALVVEQIKHMKEELGHGIMNINTKIGTVPDEVVRHSMKLWGERIAPHVRDL
jgi:hypothetical protein